MERQFIAAFPMSGSDTNAPEWGMDLRDYFAAKAMQALINKTELLVQAVLEDGQIAGHEEEFLKIHRHGIASSAYKFADSMLEARK